MTWHSFIYVRLHKINISGNTMRRIPGSHSPPPPPPPAPPPPPDLSAAGLSDPPGDPASPPSPLGCFRKTRMNTVYRMKQNPMLAIPNMNRLCQHTNTLATHVHTNTQYSIASLLHGDPRRPSASWVLNIPSKSTSAPFSYRRRPFYRNFTIIPRLRRGNHGFDFTITWRRVLQDAR